MAEGDAREQIVEILLTKISQDKYPSWTQINLVQQILDHDGRQKLA